MTDALVIRDVETGQRLAAAWSELDAYEKLRGLQGLDVSVERVRVSRRGALPRTRTAAEFDLPEGYELRGRRRLAPSTLRRKWSREWRGLLYEVAQEDGWFALRGGHALAPLTNALQQRGLIDIADTERSHRPFLYRATDRGRLALENPELWE